MFKPHLDPITGKTFYHDGNFNDFDDRWYASVYPLRTPLEQRYNVTTDFLKPFRQRVYNHIETVARIGEIYNKYDFSAHDTSKLWDEFEDHAFINTWIAWYQETGPYVAGKDFLFGEKYLVKAVIKHHQITNPHHPEFYDKISDMPDIMIIEMVCDWMAMSVEQNFVGHGIAYGNTETFYREKALKKYKFTQSQQLIIMDVLDATAAKYNPNTFRKIWAR